jgi:hypothetical protein
MIIGRELWKIEFAFIFSMLIILFNGSAYGQDQTAGDWFDKGNTLEENGSYYKAIQAYDKAIKQNLQYDET